MLAGAAQGAAASCVAVCALGLGRWCRCRVPLLCALGSLDAGAAAGCPCCVHLGAWMLVPLQGAAAVCASALGAGAGAGCWWCVHLGAWVLAAAVCALGLPLLSAAAARHCCVWLGGSLAAEGCRCCVRLPLVSCAHFFGSM